MLSNDEIKQRLGKYGADLVKPGMNIGLGTGSTVYWLIQELAQRIKQGLSIVGVPTSKQTAELAALAGIPLVDLNDTQLQCTIDGADEIDPAGQLIKGGGGALLQEKIVASASDKLIILADHSKLVKKLGKFPLPVEVIPFGYKKVEQKILASGLCKKAKLRQKDGTIFVTDHQHNILDCEFEQIDNPTSLNNWLHSIPGVVETGLFVQLASMCVVGFPDGRIKETHYATP